MKYEIIMKIVKKNREIYNKVIKYLLYISLTLLIFNIIYLQNSLIVFWINNNSRYGSSGFFVNVDANYISENEINFSSIIISSNDIKKSESNIFFIETSCCTKVASINRRHKLNVITFNIRQACAIESAASINKDSNILILYSCPINEEVLRTAPSEILQIFRYTNVKIVTFEMHEYFEGSPVDDLFIKGILETSLFPLEHTSDVLRYLTLWKYGGTYLDLDVLCLRPFKTLSVNFAGYELDTAIGSAVINFQETNIGFTLLTKLLSTLNSNFSTTQWSNNGPMLMTKVLFSFCSQVQVIREYDRIICDGFTLFKKKFFYPIPWNKWRLFFNETASNSTVQLLQDSYTVHMWNKHSHKVKVFVGSNQPYDILATQCCQLVHSELNRRYFVTY